MMKVIMFTTKTWPHCRTAKEALFARGIRFEEKDINEDYLAGVEFSRRGLQGVPAFLIGDQVVVGLDINKIEALLDYKIIGCSKCNTRMRVPKNRAKIRVTCPKCNHQFEMTT